MKSGSTNISSIISSMKKAELVELLLLIAEQDPVVRNFIEKKATAEVGVDDLLAEKYREKIAILAEEDVWYDKYTESGHLPDHWALCSEFAELNKQGHHDVFVAIGPEYLEAANILVRQVSEEENCEYGINECLLEIVKGIEQSSLPIHTRIYTVIRMDIADTWGMIGEPRFALAEHPPEVWSQVADMLIARKEEYHTPSEKKEHNFYRNQHARWVVTCLGNAGRKTEMLSFSETEARENFMYVDHINLLIGEGDLEGAKRWIELGIAETQRIYPGISAYLSKITLKNPAG